MTKITVAFADKKLAEAIASILSPQGYEVFRICTSAAEVLRAFSVCEDGLLITGFRLSDKTVESLLNDLNEKIQILVLDKSEMLELIESRRIFRLQLPIRKEALLSSVEILVQLHYQKLPHRTGSQADAVAKAKEILMNRYDMSEEQAHRFLQKTSMQQGIKMSAAAEYIIRHGK